jgi:hypothetical protein
MCLHVSSFTNDSDVAEFLLPAAAAVLKQVEESPQFEQQRLLSSKYLEF